MPLADSHDLKDRSFDALILDTKAVTQITDSFSLTWPALEQPERKFRGRVAKMDVGGPVPVLLGGAFAGHGHVAGAGPIAGPGVLSLAAQPRATMTPREFCQRGVTSHNSRVGVGLCASSVKTGKRHKVRGLRFRLEPNLRFSCNAGHLARRYAGA